MININILTSKQKICHENIEKIKMLDNSIDSARKRNFELKKHLKSIIEKKIKEKKDILSKLKGYSNQNYVSEKLLQKETFVNEKIESVNAMQVDVRKGVLTSSIVSSEEIQYNNIIISPNKKQIKIEFNDIEIINELIYLVNGKNGFPLIAHNILINTPDGEESFFESYMRFFDKNTESDDFHTSIVMTPRKCKSIIFVFSGEIDETKMELKFIKNIFSTEGSAIIKFLNKYGSNGVMLSRKHFTKWVDLKYEYSNDNVEYKEMDFYKNGAIRNFSIFETNTNDAYIYIKITRENKINEHKMDKEEKNIFLFSNKIQENPIQYKINTSEFGVFSLADLNIILSNQNNLTINKYNNFTHSNENGLYCLNKENLIEVDQVSATIKQQLLSQNTTEVITEDYNLKAYYETNTQTIYMPAFFETMLFQIDIELVCNNEYLTNDCYTPLLFEISVRGVEDA